MFVFVNLKNNDDSSISFYVFVRMLIICENCTNFDEKSKTLMMIAQNKSKTQTFFNKQLNVLQRFKNIQKTNQFKFYKSLIFSFHILKQIEIYNQQQNHQFETNENESNDEMMKNEKNSSTQSTSENRRFLKDEQKRTNHAFQIKLIKTNKVQKLIILQFFKCSNFIKNIMSKIRFINDRIFEKEISFIIDELFDVFDDLMKNMTYYMQRVISKYRVRKFVKSIEFVQSNQIDVNEVLILATTTTFSFIITQIYENDEQNQSIMIIT